MDLLFCHAWSQVDDEYRVRAMFSGLAADDLLTSGDS
jgi:hypothetical protein